MIFLKDILPEDLATYVGLLTVAQKDDITGQKYEPDSYFNPIQDINNYWVISTEEMINCINSDYMWVKELPLIIYVKKPSPYPPD